MNRSHLGQGMRRMQEQTERIMNLSKKIYEHLQDEESKYYFEKRICYAFTGESAYIGEIINHLPEKQIFDQIMAEIREKNSQIVIYGAGTDFDVLKRLYPDFDFYAFCDRDLEKQNHGWYGKPVLAPEELVKNYKNDLILITTTVYHKEIKRFLEKNQIPEKKILDLGAITEKLLRKQYFEEGIITLGEGEIFVDGGAYDGGTIQLFEEFCPNYEKIYAFEPDTKNYTLCKKNFEEGGSRKILVKKGCWDKVDRVCFSMNGNQGSRIVSDVEDSLWIETETIDHIVGKDKVTFLKLDVEGAELRALKGARNTIKKHHPKMAISIYHKPEDILEIPAYILSLSEEYDFFIRHYQMTAAETILYAI